MALCHTISSKRSLGDLYWYEHPTSPGRSVSDITSSGYGSNTVKLFSVLRTRTPVTSWVHLVHIWTTKIRSWTSAGHCQICQVTLSRQNAWSSAESASPSTSFNESSAQPLRITPGGMGWGPNLRHVGDISDSMSFLYRKIGFIDWFRKFRKGWTSSDDLRCL